MSWCNKCTVIEQNVNGTECKCDSKSKHFHVLEHDDRYSESQHAQYMHYNAVLKYLDLLQKQGHDKVDIDKIRNRLNKKISETGLHENILPKTESRESDGNLFNAERREELKRLVLDILKEENPFGKNPKETIQKELDYESGVFKILVRASERSPFNFNRVIGSSRSSGSGFLIDKKQRLIVTNGHVIRNADTVFVSNALIPRVQMRAIVLKVNFDLDIALIKVIDDKGQWDSEQINALKLCTRQTGMFIRKIENIRPDESCGYARLQRVFAVGYPLGSSSVQISNGIISGFEGVSDEAVIQMTAPISHGNSGGPLLNTRGEVIGVTNAGIPAGENIGFAIPVQTVINTLAVFADQRFASLRVIKLPYFGINFTDGSSIEGEKLPTIVRKGNSFTFRELEEEQQQQQEEEDSPNKDKTDNDKDQTDVDKDQDEDQTGDKDDGGIFVGNGIENAYSGVYITKIEPIHAFQKPIGGDMVEIQPFDKITNIAGFELTNDGVTKERTYPRSMPLKFIFRSLPFGKVYKVTFWRKGKLFTNEYEYVPVLPEEDYGIRLIEKEEFAGNRDLVIENSVFTLFDQIRLAQLNLNFIEKIEKVVPNLTYYKQESKRDKPKLLVLGDKRGGLKTTDIISKMDGKPVGTREDIFALLRDKDSQKQEFTLIEAESGRFTILKKKQTPQDNSSALLRFLMKRGTLAGQDLTKSFTSDEKEGEHLSYQALQKLVSPNSN